MVECTAARQARRRRLHIHSGSEERFPVLDGTRLMHARGRLVELGESALVHVSRGVVDALGWARAGGVSARSVFVLRCWECFGFGWFAREDLDSVTAGAFFAMQRARSPTVHCGRCVNQSLNQRPSSTAAGGMIGGVPASRRPWQAAPRLGEDTAAAMRTVLAVEPAARGAQRQARAGLRVASSWLIRMSAGRSRRSRRRWGCPRGRSVPVLRRRARRLVRRQDWSSRHRLARGPPRAGRGWMSWSGRVPGRPPC